jgi:hypothetical protein
MIVKTTRNPNVFNALCSKEWLGYYDTYALNGSCEFVEIEEGSSIFVLPYSYGNSRSEVFISGKAFVGGFVTNDLSIENSNRRLVWAFEHLTGVGATRISHKVLPDFYGEVFGYSDWGEVDGFFSTEFTGETSVVRFDEIKFSSLRSRMLKKGSGNLFVFKLVEQEECLFHWRFLIENLREKELHFLSIERVYELVTSIPERYSLYGVRTSAGDPTATILVDKFLNCYRLANYFSSKKPEHRGSFEVFIAQLMNSVAKDSSLLLDFGSSADPANGMIVQSIMDFKSSFNTRIQSTSLRTYQMN